MDSPEHQRHVLNDRLLSPEHELEAPKTPALPVSLNPFERLSEYNLQRDHFPAWYWQLAELGLLGLVAVGASLNYVGPARADAESANSYIPPTDGDPLYAEIGVCAPGAGILVVVTKDLHEKWLKAQIVPKELQDIIGNSKSCSERATEYGIIFVGSAISSGILTATYLAYPHNNKLWGKYILPSIIFGTNTALHAQPFERIANDPRYRTLPFLPLVLLVKPISAAIEWHKSDQQKAAEKNFQQIEAETQALLGRFNDLFKNGGKTLIAKMIEKDSFRWHKGIKLNQESVDNLKKVMKFLDQNSALTPAEALMFILKEASPGTGPGEAFAKPNDALQRKYDIAWVVVSTITVLGLTGYFANSIDLVNQKMGKTLWPAILITALPIDALAILIASFGQGFGMLLTERARSLHKGAFAEIFPLEAKLYPIPYFALKLFSLFVAPFSHSAGVGLVNKVLPDDLFDSTAWFAIQKALIAITILGIGYVSLELLNIIYKKIFITLFAVYSGAEDRQVLMQFMDRIERLTANVCLIKPEVLRAGVIGYDVTLLNPEGELEAGNIPIGIYLSQKTDPSPHVMALVVHANGEHETFNLTELLQDANQLDLLNELNGQWPENGAAKKMFSIRPELKSHIMDFCKNKPEFTEEQLQKYFGVNDKQELADLATSLFNPQTNVAELYAAKRAGKPFWQTPAEANRTTVPAIPVHNQSGGQEKAPICSCSIL